MPVADVPDEFPCAALPFVTVHERVVFGDIEIWPNTTAMWKSVAGTDHSGLMEIYRERDGSPRGAHASVITARANVVVTPGRIEDHVVALSTAQWLQGGETPADPWIVDHWSLPRAAPADGLYRRAHKFSRLYTRAAHDRVYPPPFLTSRYFDPNRDLDLMRRLEAELRATPREESLLPSLAHLHRARFQIPFYTSPGEEMVTLWAGFEGLLGVPQTIRGEDTSPAWARCLPSKVHGALRRAFLWEGRARRDDEVIARILAEFGRSTEVSTALREGTQVWARRAYDVRNRHAHGSTVDPTLLRLDAYEADAFAVGILLARTLLAERLMPSPSAVLAANRIARCHSFFAFTEVVERFAQQFRDRKGTDFYPNTTLSDSELHALHDALRDFSAVTSHHGALRRSNADLRTTRQTMALVLSKWSKAIDVHAGTQTWATPLRTIHSEISALDAAKVDGNELEGRVAELLRSHDSAARDAYDYEGEVPKELLLGGTIPAWDWADAYIGLAEMTE